VIPPGSTFLLFSISSLAEMGVVGYAEELIAVASIIHGKLGKTTRVLPLPPVVLGGSDQAFIVRAVFELINWSLEYFRDVRYFLEDATVKAKELLLEAGSKMRDDWEFCRLVLPSKASTVVWKGGSGQVGVLDARNGWVSSAL
jgi:hypothetical protein